MTSCYCEDWPSAFKSVMRIARKPHKCGECGGPIHIGDKYEYASGIWDGEPDSFKTCAICCALRDYVKNNIPCFCGCYGSLIEDAMEELSEADRYAPGLWFGGARFVVRARKARADELRRIKQ